VKKKKHVVIGISGSHCVGKTQLAKALGKIFENRTKVFVLYEIVRKFPKESLARLETQQKIADELKKEIDRALMKGYKIVITDRTFLDEIIYALYYACTKNWEEQECRGVLELAKKCTELTKRYYELIIYADNVEKIGIEDDGYRLTDRHSRVMVDVLFKTCLLSWKEIPVIFWNIDESIEKLVKRISKIISLPD